MRRQTRPFIVEVKQKRGSTKRNRSIWGDLDLSAIAAGTTMRSVALVSPKSELVDPGIIPIDVEDRHKPLVEYPVADFKEAEPLQSPDEAPVKGEAMEAKKKAPRPKAAKVQPKRSARKAVVQPASSLAQSPSPARTTRRTYSEKERAQKLDQIGKSIGRGETIKNAVKQAGVSEQTYYHWKKAAATISDGGDLKDLIALEEENKRLKALLAERLRKENAELKRKLGLD